MLFPLSFSLLAAKPHTGEVETREPGSTSGYLKNSWYQCGAQTALIETQEKEYKTSTTLNLFTNAPFTLGGFSVKKFTDEVYKVQNQD